MEKLSVEEVLLKLPELSEEELDDLLSLYTEEEKIKIFDELNLSDRIKYAMKYVYGLENDELIKREVIDIRKGFNKNLIKSGRKVKLCNKLLTYYMIIPKIVNNYLMRRAILENNIIKESKAEVVDNEIAKIVNELDKNASYLTFFLEVCKRINKDTLYNYDDVDDVFDNLENILSIVVKKMNNLMDHLNYVVSRSNENYTENKSFEYNGIINDSIMSLKKSKYLL